MRSLRAASPCCRRSTTSPKTNRKWLRRRRRRSTAACCFSLDKVEDRAHRLRADDFGVVSEHIGALLIAGSETVSEEVMLLVAVLGGIPTFETEVRISELGHLLFLL